MQPLTQQGLAYEEFKLKLRYGQEKQEALKAAVRTCETY
jgi:hypothetical protein